MGWRFRLCRLVPFVWDWVPCSGESADEEPEEESPAERLFGKELANRLRRRIDKGGEIGEDEAQEALDAATEGENFLRFLNYLCSYFFLWKGGFRYLIYSKESAENFFFRPNTAMAKMEGSEGLEFFTWFTVWILVIFYLVFYSRWGPMLWNLLLGTSVAKLFLSSLFEIRSIVSISSDLLQYSSKRGLFSN